MSKLNLLVHINAYEDSDVSENPSMNSYKWHRDIQGIDISEPSSKKTKLAAGQKLVLFESVQVISSDSTTLWDIKRKEGTSSTYVLSHAGGTAPAFKTLRNINSDPTTAVTVTKNAKVLKFEATGGTIFDLTDVLVGDEVRIGDVFNASNRGKYKILSVTSNSFTVENELGVEESDIVLDVDFATKLRIYSSDGIQIDHQIDITDGFSPVSHGTYTITDITDYYIEFFSSSVLPEELGILNDPEVLTVYKDAKQFVYIESDQTLDIKINSLSVTNELKPFYAGTSRKSGIFMNSGSLKRVEIINKSLSVANIFYTTAE